VPEQVSFAAGILCDAAPGLTLPCGVIPSGSNPIEIRRCSGRSHRPGVRHWYAFDGAWLAGGRVKSHCSRNAVCLQCDLMPKAPPKTRDFDWKGTLQADYLGVPLDALWRNAWNPSSARSNVGFGNTKFVSGVDGSEVRCTHFPSVAYPTESDETTDPMGGRRKTVGIPIDGLIYEVGPDVHLAADVFNAKQLHERYSETPDYLAMLRGALHYMKVERIDLLVVGLPVAAYKAKKRAALERLV